MKKEAIWQKPDDSGNPLWKCGDGRLIRLRDIKNDHLQEIERFLIGRGKFSSASMRPQLFNDWYDIIVREMNRRNLNVLIEDHPEAVIRHQNDILNRL